MKSRFKNSINAHEIENSDLPLVSVLMPAYNHERWIEQAIRGIWTQTYQNIELIIVDDASIDNTYNILIQLQVESPVPMQVFRNSNNLGIGGTLNRILQIAQGRYIMLHADDDISYPNKIEMLMHVLMEDEDVIGAHSSLHEVDLDGKVIGERHHPNLDREFSRRDTRYIIKNMNKLGIVTQSHIFKKEVFEKFGSFHKDCSHEAKVLLFREAFIGRVLYISTPLTQYRIGSGTSTVMLNNDIELHRREARKANNWNLSALSNVIQDLKMVRTEMGSVEFVILQVLCKWRYFRYWRIHKVLNKSLLFSLLGFLLFDRASVSAFLKVYFPGTFLFAKDSWSQHSTKRRSM